MSIEAYEKFKLDYMIYDKLKEAAVEAKSTDVRYDFDEVSKEMRKNSKIKILPTAKIDLGDIIDYLSQFYPSTAINQYDRIIKKINARISIDV